MVSSSNWRIIDAATAFGATSSKDRDGDETSAEKKVKNEAEESEEGDAAKEASQDDGEAGVDDSSSSHALNRLLPCWDVSVMVC